jgi:hypothetical protein
MMAWDRGLFKQGFDGPQRPGISRHVGKCRALQHTPRDEVTRLSGGYGGTVG